MLISLKKSGPLNMTILDISLAFMRIILTTDFYFSSFRMTRSFRIYQETSYMWIGFHTTIGAIIYYYLWFRSHTYWQFRSFSTRLSIKLTRRATTLEMVVDLDEGHIPIKILFFKSIYLRTISIRTAVPRERVIVTIHTRNQKWSSTMDNQEYSYLWE